MDSKDRIRVLIADDSFFIRRYLTELLASEPEIEIVGAASNGDEVVLLAAKLKPDVITMDYNMPGKNGIEAAAAIMLGERPLPTIIMLSAFLGEDGQEMRRTLEASGAQVVSKPSGEVSLDIEKVAIQIVQKIKEAGETARKIRIATGHKMHVVIDKQVELKDKQLQHVVVIGASTGGPPLVEHLLSQIDPAFGVSIVIAQHMSKYFTELFAERLNRVTSFTVREAKSDDILLPGLALVVPGGFALDFHNEKNDKNDSERKLFLIPTMLAKHEDEIDLTMEAIAKTFGVHSCGILLSGLGSDGTKGLHAIKKHGGFTIVQDPHTAIVSSMPTHAVDEGGIDAVLSVENMPLYLNDLFSSQNGDNAVS